MAIELMWEDRFQRLGRITVDSVGLRVSAGRGFQSPDLTDTAELLKLYHAIGDLLMVKEVSS